MLDRDEFYVGYEAKAPAGAARFVRRIAIAAAAAAIAVAAVLVAGQRPFAAAEFEFGVTRNYEGFVESLPYPSLLERRADGVVTRQLLVAPGKHGASSLVAGLDGRQVRVSGTSISRQGRLMIQLVPDQVRMLGGHIGGMEPAVTVQGTVTLRGEIVDGKCWMGVMNPGSGKVHQDCAALCLRGGIPPLFVSGGEVYVLAGDGGKAFGPRAAMLAARPVEIRGTVERSAGTAFLKADAAGVRLLGRF